MSELTDKARRAIDTFRDATREGRVLDHFKRDPLVSVLHRALDALDANLRCWEHRPGRGHARRCIREKGHKGQHVDFEAQYWTTGDETSAAAPAPPDWTREAFNEQLTEDAERLLETLATGDGEHSEALDLNLIKAAFRHLLTWAASPAPAQAEGFCCLCCSQMQPCQDGCKCQTPPSAPDAETPK